MWICVILCEKIVMGWNKTLIRALEKADGGMSEVKGQSEMHSSSLLSRSKTLPQNTKSWRIWLNEEYLLTFLKCNEFDSNTVEEKNLSRNMRNFMVWPSLGKQKWLEKQKGFGLYCFSLYLETGYQYHIS